MAGDGHNHESHCEHCEGASERGVAWTNALLLLAVAAFLLWAAWTGRVGHCVAPRYVWMTPFGAVFVAAMALARMAFRTSESDDAGGGEGRGRERSGDCCGHSHAMAGMSSWKRCLHRGVICLPFVLALAVDPVKLSAEGVRKRQTSGRGSGAARAGRQRLDAAFQWMFDLGTSATVSKNREGASESMASDLDLSQATVRDLVNWSDNGRIADLEGRFVSLIGQADLLPGQEGRCFDLLRVVVICCIADAVTLSLQVSPLPGDSVTSGSWLRVGGIIQYEDTDGLPTLLIKASVPVEVVSEPDYPYL